MSAFWPSGLISENNPRVAKREAEKANGKCCRCCCYRQGQQHRDSNNVWVCVCASVCEWFVSPFVDSHLLALQLSPKAQPELEYETKERRRRIGEGEEWGRMLINGSITHSRGTRSIKCKMQMLRAAKNINTKGCCRL